MATPDGRRRGFSLLEVVIVIVIIGIVAAIAIPRLSRGTAGAAESALTGDLAVLRNAIDHFAAEHQGPYPTADKFAAQLTQCTDGSNTSDPVAAKDAKHLFGPYVREIPRLPVGANKGTNKITTVAPPGTDGAGWLYNPTTGDIKANCADSEVDSKGIPYNTY